MPVQAPDRQPDFHLHHGERGALGHSERGRLVNIDGYLVKGKGGKCSLPLKSIFAIAISVIFQSTNIAKGLGVVNSCYFANQPEKITVA